MTEQVRDELLEHIHANPGNVVVQPALVDQMAEELRLWRKLGRISEKDGLPDIEIDHDGDGNYSCPICGEHLGSEEDISFEGYLRTAGLNG